MRAPRAAGRLLSTSCGRRAALLPSAGAGAEPVPAAGAAAGAGATCGLGLGAEGRWPQRQEAHANAWGQLAESGLPVPRRGLASDTRCYLGDPGWNSDSTSD